MTNRSGSILLIVLGFLALLSVSAVAFSTRMRASRFPGSDVTRQERGRFLLAAALARAESAIDGDLGTRRTADWPGRVLGAEDLSATNGVVPVLTLEALAELPSRLVERVRTRAVAAQTARWQRLDFDAGRVAFLAVDVSDLPDANHVRAATNRTSATHGRLTLAPFFETLSDAQTFDMNLAAARAQVEGFDFVSTLDLNLSLGTANAVLTGERLETAYPFVADSYAFDGGTENRVALTDGADAWRSVLEQSLTETDLRVLEDYLDKDSKPASLDLPCAERVPQVGAVAWENGHPVAAVVFPFRPASRDGTFDLTASLAVSDADGTWTRTLASEPAAIAVREAFKDDSVVLMGLSFVESFLPPTSEGGQTPPQLTFSLTLELASATGVCVDRTPPLAFSALVDGESLGAVTPACRATADARVNWKSEHWSAYERSLDDWADEVTDDAFVADTGYLQSVGELAFLPREDGSRIDGLSLPLADDRGEGPRVDVGTTLTNVLLMALVNTPCDWRSAATNTPYAERRTIEMVFGATRAELTMLAVRLMAAFKADDWRAAYDDLDWLNEGAGTDPFAGLSFADRLTTADRRSLRDYWRGCFTDPRQLFLIFLRVEYGPRGVALVARDPRPPAEGRPHAMRLIYYRQFED